MWNPLILQPHHKKNRMFTLLALRIYPWAAAHCKASVTSTEGCHSPGMDQNPTLLSTQPWMQGACVEACNTEIQTLFTSFLWYLVTEGTWSTTLCNQGSPVFQWGQHGEQEENKDLTACWIKNSWAMGGWVTGGVLLGTVSNHGAHTKGEI